MALSLVSANRRLVPVLSGRIIAATSAQQHDGRRGKSTDLAHLKRGRGGRSSFSGTVATVFGASGFLGRYVVNRLGKTGSQIVIPYRGDIYDVARMKLAGDLGQVLFYPYDLRDEESIRKAVKYSNVVINLVGRDWETKNFKYGDVHVEGARRLARVCKEEGIETLVHLSALNASPSPQSIYMKEGSGFMRSKAEGEQAVREEFPEAVIIRPADMWGQEDRFMRYYANFWRRQFGFMPMWKGGRQTVKQPVYVADVAEGIVNAIQDPEFAGRTFDAVGPNRYELRELVSYFYRCLRVSDFYTIPLTPIFRAWVALFGRVAPSYPIINPERLEREFITDVTTGDASLEDLGVRLTRVEDRAQWELKPFRQHNYYDEELGEFPHPDPPPTVSS